MKTERDEDMALEGLLKAALADDLPADFDGCIQERPDSLGAEADVLQFAGARIRQGIRSRNDPLILQCPKIGGIVRCADESAFRVRPLAEVVVIDAPDLLPVRCEQP